MSSQSRNVLRSALHGLIRPVAAFALRYGFRIQEFLEVTKLVFLDAAEDEIRRSGHEVSVSKLSVVTGIHRRDVMRLWRDEEQPKADTDVVMRVIGQWQGDRRFQSRGKPKILQLSGVTGDFRDLVFSVSSDLNPYTILFELERAGAVEVRDEGIRLLSRSLQISGDSKKGLGVLAADSSDLIAAVTENLLENSEERNLHIRTEFDNLPPEKENEVRRWLLDEGVKFHKKAEDYLARLDRDLTVPGNTKRKEAQSDNANEAIRAVVGSFGFTETRFQRKPKTPE